MKKIICITLCCWGICVVFGQSASMRLINEDDPPGLALEPLRFLASDEMMGRSSTRPEINIAARYISEKFRSFGVKELTGAPDYFQSFEIKLLKLADAGGLSVSGNNFLMKKSLFSEVHPARSWHPFPKSALKTSRSFLSSCRLVPIHCGIASNGKRCRQGTG